MDNTLDVGRFYALLRFEEAALALRATLHLNLVDRMGSDRFGSMELREMLGFTEQGARTFFALLSVMQILEDDDGQHAVTAAAKASLSDAAPTSRKPYLAMGAGDDVDQLIQLLQGKTSAEAKPLYAEEGGGETLMDITDVASAIAWGLASRARNFAPLLAAAIAQQGANARVLADIGAGSPYVAHACQQRLPKLTRVILVDRPNGMRFAREMVVREEMDGNAFEFREQDFFQSVPAADIYCISNTAHDWLTVEYAALIQNIRAAITAEGFVCIHEPLLRMNWQTDQQWIDALWMACYALTLFKLTLGKGSCYTIAEHDAVLTANGFRRESEPQDTCDGCTALFYRPTT